MGILETEGGDTNKTEKQKVDEGEAGGQYEERERE